MTDASKFRKKYIETMVHSNSTDTNILKGLEMVWFIAAAMLILSRMVIAVVSLFYPIKAAAINYFSEERLLSLHETSIRLQISLVLGWTLLTICRRYIDKRKDNIKSSDRFCRIVNINNDPNIRQVLKELRGEYALQWSCIDFVIGSSMGVVMSTAEFLGESAEKGVVIIPVVCGCVGGFAMWAISTYLITRLSIGDMMEIMMNDGIYPNTAGLLVNTPGAIEGGITELGRKLDIDISDSVIVVTEAFTASLANNIRHYVDNFMLIIANTEEGNSGNIGVCATTEFLRRADNSETFKTFVLGNRTIIFQKPAEAAAFAASMGLIYDVPVLAVGGCTRRSKKFVANWSEKILQVVSGHPRELGQFFDMGNLPYVQGEIVSARTNGKKKSTCYTFARFDRLVLSKEETSSGNHSTENEKEDVINVQN